MKDKKNRNINNIVIVLLVLIILGLGGFIVYDKVLVNSPKDEGIVGKDNDDEVDKEEDNIESLEVTSQLVTGLVDGISFGMTCKDYHEEYLFDSKFDAKNLSNEDVYSLVLQNMYEGVAANNNFVSFSADRVNEEVRKLLGKGYKFLHKTYDTCPKWEYDENAMLYKAPNPESVGCGCTSGPYQNLYSTVKAEKINDTVNIYQRVIFIDSSTGKGYKDKAKTKEINDLVRNTVDNYGNPDDSIKDDISNLNKGTLYKLVFEKEENNYIFVSSEVVSE